MSSNRRTSCVVSLIDFVDVPYQQKHTPASTLTFKYTR